MNWSLLFWIAIGIASLFLVLKSAGYAIGSIIRWAKKTKLSYYFVGLLIVSIGTSLPEIFTSIISSIEGNSELIIGDAIGATIVDITLVLAFVGIVAGSLKIKEKEVNIVPWRIAAVIALPLILAIDGRFSRIDGVILVLAFLLYYGFNIYSEIRHQKIVKDIPFSFVWKEVLIFGFNIAMLIFGVQILVLSSVNISSAIGIPQYIFGALILSICTTSPEFVVELKALVTKSSPIAFGDIFGSVICNTSLVIGLGVLINPIIINRFQFYSVAVFMFLVTLVSLVIIKRKKITRAEGIALFLTFVIFATLQILNLSGVI